MSSLAHRVYTLSILALCGCSTQPTKSALVDCAAAGHIAFNTYSKFVAELGKAGISPSIQVMPYTHMHQAILARHILNGETKPNAKRGSIWPVPAVDQAVEDSIARRMKGLSRADIEETERINRRCNKLLIAKASRNL